LANLLPLYLEADTNACCDPLSWAPPSHPSQME